MPFKSKAQMDYMYANDKKLSDKWASETPDMGDLPAKVKPKKSPWLDMMTTKKGK